MMTFPDSKENGLSPRELAGMRRRCALHGKYEQAVALYADTDMPLCRIAEECQVSAGGLKNYLRRYWRELVLRRHHVEADDPYSVKLVEAGKQSRVAHQKYREAVAACDAMEYIEYNVSQIARRFNLDGPALANFMRVHYPDILTRREAVRVRLGINEPVWHGARPKCMERYAEATELYRTTDMSLPEVAEACGISEGGFSQHLRFYHKEVLEQKRERRRSAQTETRKTRGALLGNGRKYAPSAEVEQKYARALALYKDTALTMKEIVSRTGVSAEGFRFYLHKWHKELVLERSGITGAISETADLRKARCRMKSVAAKYEKAIESLRQHPRPVTRVAAEFGFQPETFRNYLHKHEPELVGSKRK